MFKNNLILFIIDNFLYYMSCRPKICNVLLINIYIKRSSFQILNSIQKFLKYNKLIIII